MYVVFDRMNLRGRDLGAEPEVPIEPVLRNLIGTVDQVANLLAQSVTHNNQQNEQARQERNQLFEQARQALNYQQGPYVRSTLDDLRKENPSVFCGSTDADEVDNWKEVMKKKFDLLKCTDEERLRFSVYKLEGDAARWWDTTEARLARDGPITWNDFQIEFDHKFFTDQMKDRKEVEFLKFFQGSLSVAEYEAKFNSLSKFAGQYATDEGRKARRFVRGLSMHLRQHMVLKRYESYTKAVRDALNVEINEIRRPQEQHQNFKRPQPQQGVNQESYGNGIYGARKRQRGEKQGSYRGQSGDQEGIFQERPKCPTCRRRHPGICRLGRCFNCGEKGHLNNACPRPHQNLP